MTAEHNDVPDRDPRFSAVLLACLEALDHGEPISREELLARHPEFAADLFKFLEDQERVDRCAAPLRAVAKAAHLAALPTPAPHLTVSDAGGEAAPDSDTAFGDYELLGELGRGGMGIVYRARQKGLGRQVALKVVSPAEGARGLEQQRFRNEAEMVAELDHPHIVPVYEVGEYAGQLYLSMKLIEGGSLAEHLGRFASDPRAAARLVAQVARAVHHAHQRGILHRDLKPANILLDGAGEPHVTDFGLARRVEGDSGLTQSGAIVGTPSYMAPEQTTGQKGAVTVAADIYGLGAVLYALLTGRPPFRADTPLDTLVLVREREPEPPRQTNRRVARDLVTVCMKCLAKEPARRYPSAEALAEDLERWLRREPIRARRAGPWERLRKWVYRRPAVAALLTLSVVAAVALVAGLLWYNADLQRAAASERAAAERERQQRQLARQAVDKMYTQVATKWLADEPQLTSLQHEFLKEALQFYQQLVQEEAAEPTVRRETARAHRYMGDILAKLERRPEAERAYNRAITLLEQLRVEQSGDLDATHDLAIAYTGLGTLLRNACRDREAEKAYRCGLDIVGKLVRDHPGRAEYLHRLGILFMNLSLLVPAAEAEEGLQKARRIYEQLLARSPGHAEFHTGLGGVLNNLAIQRLEKGDPALARRLLEQAVGHQQAALKLNPRSRTSLLFLRNHYVTLGGDVLRVLGEREAALKAAREGLALAQRLAAEFPAVPAYEDGVADAQHGLARALKDLDRLSEAEKEFRQAQVLREKAVARTPEVPALRSLLAETCTNLGGVLEASDRYQEAVTQFRRALELEPQSFAYKINLAWALTVPRTATRQEAEEAVALTRQAVKQSPRLWKCWNALGAALYRTGEWEQARQALEKVFHLEKALPAPPHLFLAMAQWQLGNKGAALRRYREVTRLMGAMKNWTPEWRRLQAEAAALMNVQDAVRSAGIEEEPKAEEQKQEP